MNDFTRISTGQPPVNTPRARQDRVSRTDSAQGRGSARSPRARINFIPNPDELRKLVDDALTALSRGIYWDRGSILDIVL